MTDAGDAAGECERARAVEYAMCVNDALVLCVRACVRALVPSLLLLISLALTL